MSHKLTTYHRPSITVLIGEAATLEELAALMKRVVVLKGASRKTRKDWADACERRKFILERSGPKQRDGGGEPQTAPGHTAETSPENTAGKAPSVISPEDVGSDDTQPFGIPAHPPQ